MITRRIFARLLPALATFGLAAKPSRDSELRRLEELWAEMRRISPSLPEAIPMTPEQQAEASAWIKAHYPEWFRKLPEGHEILRSFDARDWAKAFVQHVRQIPGIATDEDTMTGWFANALMRGWDEHVRRYPHSAATQIESDVQQVRGAVARGWCADKNREKVMDCDLAEAISQEIMKLKT